MKSEYVLPASFIKTALDIHKDIKHRKYVELLNVLGISSSNFQFQRISGNSVVQTGKNYTKTALLCPDWLELETPKTFGTLVLLAGIWNDRFWISI